MMTSTTDVAADVSSSGPGPPLLDEIEEALAHSMLVFLMADLRLLSATGRCKTKFETIAIPSDAVARTTAAHMAGLTDSNEDRFVSANEFPGLTSAQCMAILILELHSQVDKNRKEKGQNDESDTLLVVEKTPSNKVKMQLGNESMDSLLKAYAEMIGRDLNTVVPHVEARKSMLAFAEGSLVIDEDREEEEEEGKEEGGGGGGSAGGDDLPTRVQRAFKDVENPVTRSKVQRAFKDVENPVTRSKLQRANPVNQSIFKGSNVRRAEQFEEVIDAVFEMGEKRNDVRQSMMGSGSRTLSQEEMVKVLEKAVESREDDHLPFMQKLFKKDSVSQLMARSRAKIVWMNDWYPLKDLTYAIAVDEDKKRVLVFFRGAITRADWSAASDWNQFPAKNPVKEDYEGKSETIGISRGFRNYLFRKRQDTGTRKVDEILNLTHKYGMEAIGSDYSLVVVGHSLGAALSSLFGFYASTDERFTCNGPVKVFTFGSPYVGGHTMADAFRHQERTGKLRYARVYDHNDTVAHLPTNFGVTSVSIELKRSGFLVMYGYVYSLFRSSSGTHHVFSPSYSCAYMKRGSTFCHVGIGIKLPEIPKGCCRCLMPKWKPSVFYIGKEGFWKSYGRGIGRNFLFHMPLPWRIAKMHTLDELQERLIYGSMLKYTGGKFELLEKPIDELYEMFLEDKK